MHREDRVEDDLEGRGTLKKTSRVIGDSSWKAKAAPVMPETTVRVANARPTSTTTSDALGFGGPVFSSTSSSGGVSVVVLIRTRTYPPPPSLAETIGAAVWSDR